MKKEYWRNVKKCLLFVMIIVVIFLVYLVSSNFKTNYTYAECYTPTGWNSGGCPATDCTAPLTNCNQSVQGSTNSSFCPGLVHQCTAAGGGPPAPTNPANSQGTCNGIIVCSGSDKPVAYCNQWNNNKLDCQGHSLENAKAAGYCGGAANVGGGCAWVPPPPPPPTSTPMPTLTPVPTTPPGGNNSCPATKGNGDANCDGVIDLIDYSIWLNNQCHPGPGQSCADTRADFNGDGNVDDTDYGIWQSHFGQ